LQCLDEAVPPTLPGGPAGRRNPVSALVQFLRSPIARELLLLVLAEVADSLSEKKSRPPKAKVGKRKP
jgi:hypothetical protein